MDEYTMYEYVRDTYRELTAKIYRPLTENLIVHLVGKFGLDVLKNTKLIEPTEYHGTYVLSCERT